MGAGKSTVARQLAEALSYTFRDSDQEIQRRTGVDIPTIFEFEGEEGFRNWERQVIEDLVAEDRIVLATGGGAILDAENRQNLAARGVVAGTMTLGDLVLVNAFLLQLFIPLNFLGVVYSQLKHALADMQLMFQVLDREPEITDRPGARELAIDEAEVRFDHVSFSYEQDRKILHDVSFTIHPGQKVAVVGPSGGNGVS